MWAAFKSRRRRHMWIELVVSSLPCSEVFLRILQFFGLNSKINTSKSLPSSNSIWTNTRTALNDSLRTLTCLVGKQIAVFFGLCSCYRRHNLIPRWLGLKLGFVPIFHFPVPRLSNIPKKILFFVRKLANGSRQHFPEYSKCFHLLLRTYLEKENYDNNVPIRHFRNGARFAKG